VKSNRVRTAHGQKSDYKTICERFYRWLGGSEEYPSEVRWTKARVVGANRKLPEELLTESDVSRMVQAADFGRDRALIVALYESGCRVGEIGQLQIRHVEFDEHGARLIVRGKTGMRRVRVVRAGRAEA
jgi:integrase/recombinase XerD